MKKIIIILFTLWTALSTSGQSVLFATAGGSPFLTATPNTLTSFVSTAGSLGTSQSYNLVGGNLGANNATITAPSGFVVSLDNSTFSGSVTANSSGGGINTTIWVALASGNTAGGYSGNVTNNISALSLTAPVSVSGTTSGGGGGATFKAITFDKTQIGGVDQTGFSVKFTTTQTYLKSVANGGGVVNASGFDINFSSDNAGASMLSWEIIKWDPTTGFLQAVVKTDLSSSVNSVIYISYGGSATTFQGGSQGSAYDANYVRMWHMDEVLTAANQSVKDWTSNNASMTSKGTWSSGQSVTGQFGKALQLTHANSDYFSYSNVTLSGAYTLAGWFNANSGTVDGDTWAFDSDPFSTGSNEMAFGDPGGFVGLFTSSGGNKVQASTPISNNTWHYIVFTRNGTAWTLYIDGSSNATSSQGSNLILNTIGSDDGFFTNDEICDELELHNTPRSASWVTANYNNTKPSSTFYSVAP